MNGPTRTWNAVVVGEDTSALISRGASATHFRGR
jgi:hypothetical protein